MVILPSSEEETRKFCHWLDIIQVQPVTHSCFKRFELSEHKEFAFWFLDEKQIIMTSKEFPFPASEKFVTIERFKDILNKRKNKYSSLIFSI